MPLTKEQIKSAALKLDPSDREALAEELLLSIDGAERDEVDSAWLAEARRRDALLAAGKTHANPVEQVIERLTNKARNP